MTWPFDGYRDKSERGRGVERLTFLQDEDARMIEEEVPERITLGIDVGFAAQARRFEERERLKCPQRRLTLGYCYGRACD